MLPPIQINMRSLEGGDSRSEILRLLKKAELSIEDLSSELNISPTAVRQHLAVLMGDGLIKKTAAKKGMGRPKFVYFLTEKAEGFFQKAYSQLAERMIEEVIEKMGVDGARKMMWKMGARHASYYIDETGGENISENVDVLVEILGENGALVELEREGASIIIKNYNCTQYNLSKKFGTLICEFDKSFISTLLNSRVETVTLIADGSRCCTFKKGRTSKSEKY
jgi:predicted ArsR family transcriptional regulator